MFALQNTDEFIKYLLKDIIIDQKSFMSSKKTIIHSFPEKPTV